MHILGGVGGGPPPHFFGATPVSDPSSEGSDLAAHNHVQKCSGFPAAAIRWRDLFGAPNPLRRARGARGSLLSFPHLKSAVRNLPHPYGRCRKPRAQVCGPRRRIRPYRRGAEDSFWFFWTHRGRDFVSVEGGPHPHLRRALGAPSPAAWDRPCRWGFCACAGRLRKYPDQKVAFGQIPKHRLGRRFGLRPLRSKAHLLPGGRGG